MKNMSKKEFNITKELNSNIVFHVDLSLLIINIYHEICISKKIISEIFKISKY